MIEIENNKYKIITDYRNAFDKEEFLIETTMGFLVVKGDGLELIKLDTISGNVSIKGIINAFTYIDDNSKKEKDRNHFLPFFRICFNLYKRIPS